MAQRYKTTKKRIPYRRLVSCPRGETKSGRCKKKTGPKKKPKRKKTK